MVQAVILSSVVAAGIVLCLLLISGLRRAHRADRPDGPSGVREVRAVPAPPLPTAGAAAVTPPPVPQPDRHAEPVVRSAKNNGSARFARPIHSQPRVDVRTLR